MSTFSDDLPSSRQEIPEPVTYGTFAYKGHGRTDENFASYTKYEYSFFKKVLFLKKYLRVGRGVSVSSEFVQSTFRLRGFLQER